MPEHASTSNQWTDSLGQPFHEGDILRLGQPVMRGNDRTPITFYFEAKVAGGKVGEQLAQAQTTAIHDILAYIANKNAESDEVVDH